MNLQVVMLAIALVIATVLALLARRGRERTLEEWTVARRGFGGLFVFLLMAGEIYTAVTFLGVSGFAYGVGGPAIYILAYGCLAYVLSYWLLPPVWRYARRHRLLSQADVLAHRYDSRALGVITAVVAVAALVPYLAVQLKGLGLIVSAASRGTISATLAIWIGLAALCAYVIASGIRGSAWTAAVKDVLALAIVVFLGIYVPLHYFGGVSEMFHRIDDAKPGFLRLPDAQLTPLWFSSTVLLTALGFYMWPHTMGAALTARSERAFRVNAALLPLYNLLLLFVFFVGFAAVLRVPGLTGGEADLSLLRVSDATFGPWLMGLIGAAGLLTALVPGSIILVTTATVLARNVYGAVRPAASEQQVSRLARCLVLPAAVAAAYMALSGGQTIIDLLLLGYALVTQLFPAVVAGLLPRRPLAAAGAAAGIIAGVLAVVVLSVTKTTVSAGATLGSAFPSVSTPFSELNLGIVALAINVVTAVIVSGVLRRASAKARLAAAA